MIIVEKKMDVNDWFNLNYERLKTICKKVSKLDDVDELLHFCLEQVLFNEKFRGIENEEERVYFFTRVVRNNFNSNKSPYHTKYRKHKFLDITDVSESHQIDRNPPIFNDIDMEWVNYHLKKITEKEWYYGRLFQLYIEEGCSLTKLSNRTTIPINTVSRDIKKVREKLIKLRNDQNDL